MIDQAKIEAMLAELTEVLRRNGFAMDIGDGDFWLYRLESPGNDGVARLRWDGERGLVIDD